LFDTKDNLNLDQDKLTVLQKLNTHHYYPIYGLSIILNYLEDGFRVHIFSLFFLLWYTMAIKNKDVKCMKIGIIGSGDVGKTLAIALNQNGQKVMLSSRAPEGLASFITDNPEILIGNPFETASFGEVVINATPGLKSLDALLPLKHALDDKTLIDLSNPLEFPDQTLSVANTDSLGEQIQRLLPETKVIKTLNTVNSKIMVNPSLLGTLDHVMFISGNDFIAKQVVTDILKELFNWKHVIDLGDIRSARTQEMLLPLWLKLYEKMGNAMFNFNIVKKE